MINNIKTTLFVLLLIINHMAISRGWTDFVKDQGMKPGESDRAMEIYDSKKQSFKDLVKQWELEEVKEQQIQDYVKYGIDKKLATQAINERLKLAQQLIDSDFPAINDISPTLDYLDNRVATMNHIAVLGHERFKNLAKKYDMEIADGFYQCLCRSKGVMGSGLGYSPEPDNHCNNSDPCKGGNWGCSSSDLPKQGDSWMSCAKKFPLKNGNNIFQEFDEHVNANNKFDQQELAEKLFDRTLKFKDLCLPSMDAKNIEDIQNIFKNNMMRNAVDIAENAENVCEEAMAVSLYLNSEKRTTDSEAVIEGFWTWVAPNVADYTDLSIKRLVMKGKISLVAGKSLPIISGLMNVSSNIDLVKRVYIDERKADAQYKEAYKLFQESKTMEPDSLDSYTDILTTKIDTLKNKIDTSDERYFNQFDMAAARVIEGIESSLHGKGIKYNQKSIDALWVDFANKQEKLKKEYENKKADMLSQLAELSLYKKVISEYRKPLNEKGCDEFIKDRLKQCKEELIRQSRETKIGQG